MGDNVGGGRLEKHPDRGLREHRTIFVQLSPYLAGNTKH
jgi:hypothetical protein